MSSMPTITHVLFDMDGLLLDTETFYTVAQEKIASQHGKIFTWDLKAKMMGQKAIEAARIYVDELELGGTLTPEEFLEQREAILDQLFPTATLMPGVERLLRHLYTHGIPIALATSSHRRHFDLKTRNHGHLFDLFDHITTGDAIQRGKPAPDIFLHAAQKWQQHPTPSHSLVFEDAPSGVAAAKSAGMHVIMVPDPNLHPDQHQGADEVLSSLLEFDPTKYGLPPFPV